MGFRLRDGPRVGYFTIDGHLVSAYDLFDGEYVPCVALEGQDVQLKICDLNEERMDAHLARVFLFGADEEYRTYFRHICERDELLVDQSRHLEVLSHVVDQHSALSGGYSHMRTHTRTQQKNIYTNIHIQRCTPNHLHNRMNVLLCWVVQVSSMLCVS